MRLRSVARRTFSALPIAALVCSGAPVFASVPVRLWGETGAPVTVASPDEFGNATSDGAGGTIFAWMQDREDSFDDDLYVQRLDANGAFTWTAGGITIAQGTAEGSGYAPSSSPAITADGAGGAIVAWLDSRADASGVYAQRITANGIVAWPVNGVPVATACPPSGACGTGHDGVQIAGDGAGGAIVVWWESRNGSYPSVWAQRIRADGTAAWPTNGVRVASGDFFAWFPKLAADGSGGAFVSWVQDGLHAQRLDPNGASSWGEGGVQIASFTRTLSERGHRLAADGVGGAILVWVHGRGEYPTPFETDIYAQRLSGGGSKLWPAGGLPVCTRGQNQYAPVVAPDGAGGAVIAWEDQGAATGLPGTGGQWIMAQRVNAVGAAQWANDGVVASSDHSAEPSILSDGSGGAFVGWGSVAQHPYYGQPVIKLQHVAGDGQQAWGPSGFEVYRLPAGNYIVGPGLVTDNAGGAVVHWQDFRFTAGLGRDIFANRVTEHVPAPPATPADLSLTLVASPEPVPAGGDATFTATVTNSGPHPATWVVLIAALPQPSAVQATSQGTCVGSGLTSCNLGALAAGATATVIFVVPAPYFASTLPASGFVAGNQADPDAANNTATVVATVAPPDPIFRDGFDAAGRPSLSARAPHARACGSAAPGRVSATAARARARVPRARAGRTTRGRALAVPR